MILTGKTREDFKKWCKIQNNLKLGLQIPNSMGGVVFDLSSNIEALPKIFQHALMIEWFDSVGINIEILKEPINYGHSIHKGYYKKSIFSCGGFDSRQEATTEAIIKANEIYKKL